MKKYTITFFPDEKSTEAESGITLMEAAEKAGIHINSLCGGEGVCGTSIPERYGSSETAPSWVPVCACYPLTT